MLRSSKSTQKRKLRVSMKLIKLKFRKIIKGKMTNNMKYVLKLFKYSLHIIHKLN
jgi:hypothetical protein